VAAANPNTRIYVTGFGLGGVEAEAQALALGSRVTGGVTFGAPGLPGHQVNGSESTVTNFVDYGDPVGNWASDRRANYPNSFPRASTTSAESTSSATLRTPRSPGWPRTCMSCCPTTSSRRSSPTCRSISSSSAC
jgi:dienelactone hydrolase